MVAFRCHLIAFRRLDDRPSPLTSTPITGSVLITLSHGPILPSMGEGMRESSLRGIGGNNVRHKSGTLVEFWDETLFKFFRPGAFMKNERTCGAWSEVFVFHVVARSKRSRVTLLCFTISLIFIHSNQLCFMSDFTLYSIAAFSAPHEDGLTR